jgi:hypothetical protein
MTWKGWEDYAPGGAPAAASGKAPRRQKYNAKRATGDGMSFDSKHEAERWGELQLLLEAGAIRNLRRQVRFGLHPKMSDPAGEVGCYVADFVYEQVVDGRVVTHIEDAKGYRLPLYRWKKRHFELEYGIRIEEV